MNKVEATKNRREIIPHRSDKNTNVPHGLFILLPRKLNTALSTYAVTRAEQTRLDTPQCSNAAYLRLSEGTTKYSVFLYFVAEVILPRKLNTALSTYAVTRAEQTRLDTPQRYNEFSFLSILLEPALEGSILFIGLSSALTSIKPTIDINIALIILNGAKANTIRVLKSFTLSMPF